MSSVTNYPNNSTSTALSQSDNDEENALDSSYNRQNESMMHKVKDVVSKIFHPSFLFSTNDDSNSSKRKRSVSVEGNNVNNEPQSATNGHTKKSKYDRPIKKDDEPELTDDDDNNSRDVPTTEQDLTETEQQKKRRRTANYQHILSTTTTTSSSHHDDQRTSSPLIPTDSVRSLSNNRMNQTSNTTPIRIEQNPNERLNRLTASKQRFNILPTYRGSTSNYDPSKSPLFAAGNRKPSTDSTTTTTTTTTTAATTNLKSNEFSANHLLASSLVNRTQPSSLSNRQQSSSTLTKPVTTNNTNRLLSNERQMFGVNYASINSRRLPYIERLRRRTLEDCIRLNQTTDNEPLSRSIIEEHKSTTTTPVPKRTKTTEKDCGIQCDILPAENSIESNKKTHRTFPPADIRDEALSAPVTEKNQCDSSIQTNSSITIERIQPLNNITKPKVLGNITPFSWPKFARAQEEYAKKYPEKCRSDAVVPSTIQKSNVNNIPSALSQTTTSLNINTMSKLPIYPFTPSRSAEAIWKCPSCTKENPAQTALCSLCHGINPNYKKTSVIEAPKTIEKQPVLSNKLPDVITKESSITTPSITTTNQVTPTTTKENVLSIPTAVTTSAISTTFPPFGITSGISAPVTTKESSTTSTTPLSFGLTATTSSSTTTTQQNPISTNASLPIFGVTPTVSSPATTTTTTTTTTTKENPVTSSAPFQFGVATTKENPLASSAPFQFGIITTKENPLTSSTPPQFGITTFTKTSTTSISSPFPSTTAFPPFIPPTSPSVSTTAASSTAPSTTTVPSTASTPFGTSSTITTTTPVVSTVSFGQPSTFTLTSSASAPSLTTITTAPVVTTATNLFPALSAGSAFTIPNTSPFTSAAIASASPAYGSGSLTFPSTTTTTTTSASPIFGSGGLGFPSAPVTTVATSASPAFGNGNLNFPSTSPATTTATTSALPAFGISGSSFSLAPTTTATSTAPFTFVAGGPTATSTSTVLSPMNTTSALPFGSITSLGTGSGFGTGTQFGTTSTQSDKTPSSISAFLPSGTSNISAPTFAFGSLSNTTQASAAPTFGFGSTSNTSQVSTAPTFAFGSTSNTSQASTASTGGFAFGSSPNTIQTSTTTGGFSGGFQFGSSPTSTPVFGASAPLLSSPFSVGTTSAAPTNNTSLFQFSAPGSTSISPESTIDPSNPYNPSSGESTSGRVIIKARRRRP